MVKQVFFTAILIVLAVLVMLCLVRAIIGPRIADRIVAVNMMGTMVIVIIAVLTVMLEEAYLADICIIYALISFLAVIVLTKVYMGVYKEKKLAEAEGEKPGGKECAEDQKAKYAGKSIEEWKAEFAERGNSEEWKTEYTGKSIEEWKAEHAGRGKAEYAGIKEKEGSQALEESGVSGHDSN